ncbi:MAG TPA: MFS transporter [Candidatus Limnocylindrales bacterium]|nr:MFS transporter [Candidatus Limnocylindrales bacterium]
MSATARTMTTRAVSAVRELDRPLALLAAMAFITQLGVAVMLPLLPLYATQLGASPTVLGLLTAAFGVTNAIGQLTGGFLAERFPARRLVPTGIGVYAAANVLIATAAAAVPLVAFRALAGLGAGLNQVAERLYVTQVTASARRAFANGVLSAAGAAGSVAGPAIGGLLAAVSDLRVPFILVGVTSALATGAALFLPRPRRESVTATPDLAGAAEGMPALTAADASDAPSTAPLARRPLAILLVSNLALMSGFGAFITTYAPFATANLGWSKAEVGIVFSMFGLGSVVLGPWLARRADRTGRRRMAIVGVIPVVAFTLALALALPRPVLYATAIVGGGGLTAFEASWFALLAGATDDGRRGRAFGFVTAVSNLGIVVGAMLAAQAWELVDIRLGVILPSISLALAGATLLAYPGDRRE